VIQHVRFVRLTFLAGGIEMKLPILVILLSLFAVSAFAQAADTTATAVTPLADTTAVTTTPPTPPPTETASTSDSDGDRSWRIGVGVHYMETVGDIKDAEGFDTNAFNALLAAKRDFGLIVIELDSEWSFDYGGTDHTLWMPQAFAFLDFGLLYGGAGIGAGYLDQEWFDNPVYSLRAGVKVGLGRFEVDINASYQFLSTKVLESIDSDSLDSVTFGAILWF
jgi:hypothetical protein